jgi:hypothetical protein
MIYDVIDGKMGKDESLKESSIMCKGCGSIIQLQGFEMFKDIIKVS